jgi:myo-inositol-1-phosphate synthase
LIQGIHLAKQTSDCIDILGGYSVKDIRFVAAFDVDKRKVGRDLADAIYQEPNNTMELCEVPLSMNNAWVHRGMTHDGIAPHMTESFRKSDHPTDNVIQILKDAKTHVVVNYLPVGSEEATKWYVEQVLQAGCAFVNCIPVFIASDKTGYWPSRFIEAKLPVLGDDVKSQIGATVIHRVLTRLFRERGVIIDRTYQLNFGGNTDFQNMLDRSRLHSKKISKTGSVQSQLEVELDDDNIHVGPSDYVPWLKDRKWAYIRMEGRNFGGAPVNVELKLEVHDSPNSAGVVVDAIRCAKVALDRGLYGPIQVPSSVFFKTPPGTNKRDDFQMKEDLKDWLEALEAHKADPAPK